MKKPSKGTIYIMVVVAIIAGYSLWVNVFKDTVPKGFGRECVSSLYDKFTVRVSEVEYMAGIMTVNLVLDFNPEDYTEGYNETDIKLAAKTLFNHGCYLESEGIKYKPIDITTEAYLDFEAYQFASAKISFLVDDDRDYLLNIQSYEVERTSNSDVKFPKDIKFKLK